jgi:hypothetical protein
MNLYKKWNYSFFMWEMIFWSIAILFNMLFLTYYTQFRLIFDIELFDCTLFKIIIIDNIKFIKKEDDKTYLYYYYIWGAF